MLRKINITIPFDYQEFKNYEITTFRFHIYTHISFIPEWDFIFTVFEEEIIFILQMKSFELVSNYSVKKQELPYSQSRN